MHPGVGTGRGLQLMAFVSLAGGLPHWRQHGLQHGSRTAPHEDRGRPGRGRRWRTRRTTAYGHRRLHLRGSGPVVSLTRGRSGVTAPCGTPRGKLLHCCRRRWPMRRPMLWTTPRWPSSSKRRSARRGKRRRRRRGKWSEAGSGGEGAVACAAEGVEG